MPGGELTMTSFLGMGGGRVYSREIVGDRLLTRMTYMGLSIERMSLKSVFTIVGFCFVSMALSYLVMCDRRGGYLSIDIATVSSLLSLTRSFNFAALITLGERRVYSFEFCFCVICGQMLGSSKGLNVCSETKCII